MPLTHWRLLRPFGEPVSPGRTEEGGGGWPREPGERVPPYWERGGGLRGGMASGGGSLGLIACLLLLQPKPREAWAAASVLSTSSFPSGLSEAPKENPPPPTRLAYKMPTTRSPYANFSLGNLVRVVCGKRRAVARPGVGADDTLNPRDGCSSSIESGCLARGFRGIWLPWGLYDR